MPRVPAICALILLALPLPAAAEFHFTPMVGLTFRGRTSIVDVEAATDNTHKNFGGSIGWFGSGIFGAEVIGTWTPGFFEAGEGTLVQNSRARALMANVIVTTPRRWSEYSLRPFLSGGVGQLTASTDEVANVLPFNVKLTGFNIGGGAIGFLSENTGVRFDLRYYGTLNRTEETLAIGPAYLRYMTASIGIVFRR